MKVKETAAAYRTQKKIYTYQDYLNLPNDRNRYEIINGELIMTPAPKIIHQDISRNIEIELALFVQKHKLGKVYDAPCDIVLSNENVVQPDILFISKENMDIITEDNIQGAPDIVVEILSPSTGYYDLVAKKEIYETFGVKEYWIVDPKMQWVEIYIIKENRFNLYQRIEKTGKIQSQLLKGFELDLEIIFKKGI